MFISVDLPLSTMSCLCDLEKLLHLPVLHLQCGNRIVPDEPRESVPTVLEVVSVACLVLGLLHRAGGLCFPPGSCRDWKGGVILDVF